MGQSFTDLADLPECHNNITSIITISFLFATIVTIKKNAFIGKSVCIFINAEKHSDIIWISAF